MNRLRKEERLNSAGSMSPSAISSLYSVVCQEIARYKAMGVPPHPSPQKPPRPFLSSLCWASPRNAKALGAGSELHDLPLWALGLRNTHRLTGLGCKASWCSGWQLLLSCMVDLNSEAAEYLFTPAIEER